MKMTIKIELKTRMDNYGPVVSHAEVEVHDSHLGLVDNPLLISDQDKLSLFDLLIREYGK